MEHICPPQTSLIIATSNLHGQSHSTLIESRFYWKIYKLMKYFKIPEFLFEVFGEKQSALEITCTAVFALVGSWIIYTVAETEVEVATWKAVAAYILIADVLAGCISNFSYGTNEYYSQRPKNRLIFIAIHFHILAIAWLLSAPMVPAFIVWGFTVASAFLVNALNGKRIQGFVAANLMCYGVLLITYLPLPKWFLMVSVLFMVKVLFSFSVDHYVGANRTEI